MTESYRKNHYIPVWYQKQFIPASRSDAEIYHLDLRPDIIRIPGRQSFKAKDLKKSGPKHIFFERDLYTRNLNGIILTD
jgi:hypothetical protein